MLTRQQTGAPLFFIHLLASTHVCTHDDPVSYDQSAAYDAMKDIWSGVGLVESLLGWEQNFHRMCDHQRTVSVVRLAHQDGADCHQGNEGKGDHRR